MTPLFVFLAGRDQLTQHVVHGDIHTWLSNRGGCLEVWYEPSRLRRFEVHATIDPEMFLGRSYPTDRAELRVEFEFPAHTGYDCYVIHWIEADRGYSVGWHQDDTHSSLGECHVQLDSGSDTVAREPAEFYDHHPLNVLERRLDQLPSVLERVTWENETPEFER